MSCVAQRWAGVASFLALAVTSGTTATAGQPLSEHDFSLRFPAATSRFAGYADVAAMANAQAASEWSSSLNPASAAWPHPSQKFTRSFSPQFSAIKFDQGSDLSVFTEALIVNAGNWGVFLPAAAQIRTNHATDRTGLGFDFEGLYFQLQWATMVGKRLAVGATVHVTATETRLDAAGFDVAQSRGETYGLRLGLVQEALPRLRIGATVDYAFGPARTTTQVFDPTTFAFRGVQSRDDSQQGLLRTGVAWEYAKGCTLAIDYQGGVFTNSTGTLWVHRFPVGIEHAFFDGMLYVRAGTLMDTRGDVAATAGLGLSLGRQMTMDVAYQYNMFPEIEEEFDDSQTFTVSFGLAF